MTRVNPHPPGQQPRAEIELCRALYLGRFSISQFIITFSSFYYLAFIHHKGCPPAPGETSHEDDGTGKTAQEKQEIVGCMNDLAVNLLVIFLSTSAAQLFAKVLPGGQFVHSFVRSFVRSFVCSFVR